MGDAVHSSYNTSYRHQDAEGFPAHDSAGKEHGQELWCGTSSPFPRQEFHMCIPHQVSYLEKVFAFTSWDLVIKGQWLTQRDFVVPLRSFGWDLPPLAGVWKLYSVELLTPIVPDQEHLKGSAAINDVLARWCMNGSLLKSVNINHWGWVTRVGTCHMLLVPPSHAFAMHFLTSQEETRTDLSATALKG